MGHSGSCLFYDRATCPRVSDRTMVGNCHLLLASAKDAAGRTRTNMTPRASCECEKENRARAKCIAAANRGWMSEKIPPPAGQEKCFYLTSPFIEPAQLQWVNSDPGTWASRHPAGFGVPIRQDKGNDSPD